MKSVILITLRIYAGAWGLVLLFPEFSACFPGGGNMFTLSAGFGAFVGSSVMGIWQSWSRRNDNNH